MRSSKRAIIITPMFLRRNPKPQRRRFIYYDAWARAFDVRPVTFPIGHTPR